MGFEALFAFAEKLQAEIKFSSSTELVILDGDQFEYTFKLVDEDKTDVHILIPVEFRENRKLLDVVNFYGKNPMSRGDISGIIDDDYKFYLKFTISFSQGNDKDEVLDFLYHFVEKEFEQEILPVLVNNGGKIRKEMN